MTTLCDPAAERAVLAGIFSHGNEAYIDVADIVTPRTFTIDSNDVLYRCLEHMLKEHPDARPDVPSVLSAARTLGLEHKFAEKEEQKHLRAVCNMQVHLPNVRKMAAKVRKLEIARVMDDQMETVQANLRGVTGDESAAHIVGMVQNPVLDFTSLLTDTEIKGVKRMGANAKSLANHLMDNPRDIVGIRTGFDHWDAIVGGGLRAGGLDIWGARQKTGKAQPLDAVVQTPDGPRLMGDIRPGDVVCTPHGGTTTVTNVYPQGMKDIYRVTFVGGDSVECCDEHLWEVRSQRKNTVDVLPLSKIRKSLKLYKGMPKWRVRLPEGTYRNPRTLPIHPYLLGVMVGDGGFRGPTPTITNIDEDILSSARSLLENGYGLRNSGADISYRMTDGGKEGNFYTSALKSLGLWYLKSTDKFIPRDYMLATTTDRLAFMQGLMDTDGSVDEKGNVELSTSSNRLANNVKEMIESLGGMCRIVPRVTSCDGKSFPSYRLHIRHRDAASLFSLERKRKRIKTRKKRPLTRAIESVEYVGKKEAQCIKVASEDGLYLTDHHVVTHNTFAVDNVAHFVASGGWGKIDSLPVLNVDLEMDEEEHVPRLLSLMTGLDLTKIEQGKYGGDQAARYKIDEAADRLDAMPYDYLCGRGMESEDILAYMRRWVLREVGLQANGKAKPCLIIYDWLKLTSANQISNHVKEYQVLSFITSGLKNFMGRYGASCLCFAQLNRDAMEHEDTRVLRGSDSILDFCTSFSIYKWKSEMEMAAELGSKVKYTHKLIPLIGRFGPGLRPPDYINVAADYSVARITEGPVASKMGENAGNRSGNFNVGEQDEIVFAAPATQP